MQHQLSQTPRSSIMTRTSSQYHVPMAAKEKILEPLGTGHQHQPQQITKKRRRRRLRKRADTAKLQLKGRRDFNWIGSGIGIPIVTLLLILGSGGSVNQFLLSKPLKIITSILSFHSLYSPKCILKRSSFFYLVFLAFCSLWLFSGPLQTSVLRRLHKISRQQHFNHNVPQNSRLDQMGSRWWSSFFVDSFLFTAWTTSMPVHQSCLQQQTYDQN